MGFVKKARYKLVYKPVKAALRTLGYRIVRLHHRDDDALGHSLGISGNILAANWERDSDSAHSTLLNKLILAMESKNIKAAIVKPVESLLLKIAVLNEDRERAHQIIGEFAEDNNLQFNSFVSKTGNGNDSRVIDTSVGGIISLAPKSNTDMALTFELEFWELTEDSYIAPKRNLIAKKLWKDVADKCGIFTPGKIKDVSEVLRHPHQQKVSFPIDLVFTWVNADDPNWKKLYRSYAPTVHTDGTSRARFHNRDELKYALRSWATYAPFIRNIYIVSNCAPPAWLNLNVENIRWVPHEEILPTDALPTFSSHAIECCIHKINGLAEHFIYSNDDFLLTRPTKPSDFFYPNGIAKVRIEPYGMVNGEAQPGQPDYLNAARNSNTLLEQEFCRTSTQLVTHSPQPILKEVIFELEKQYPDEFHKTIYSRFRAVTDIGVTAFLSAHYSILTRRAIPDQRSVLLIQQNHDYEHHLHQLISFKNSSPRKLPLSVCLNDGAGSHLNESWNRSVITFLDAFYPAPSKFER